MMYSPIHFTAAFVLEAVPVVASLIEWPERREGLVLGHELFGWSAAEVLGLNPNAEAGLER
jgi:hypothetical protein